MQTDRQRRHNETLEGPTLAIVGRPNVGKSTLFNRLVGGPRAVTGDTEGTTRDRNYGGVVWEGRPLVVVDTGGYVPGRADALLERVKEQVLVAVEEADAVLFVVDARTGPSEGDLAIARVLQRSRRPVVVVANKADHAGLETEVFDHLSLGLGEATPVSAEHGRQVDVLLDRVLELLTPRGLAPAEGDAEASGETARGIRAAFVGRPNVGKSSLLNALLGESRVLVDEVAGTTRDAVDSRLEVDGRGYTLVDTAGIRRMARRESEIEYWSVLRSERAIGRAHVGMLVVDAGQGPTRQDARIAGMIEEWGRGLVLVVNKWDLVPRADRDVLAHQRELAKKFPFVRFAPVMFVSALSGDGVDRLLPAVDAVHAEWSRMLPVEALVEMVERALIQRPPAVRGRLGKVRDVRQVATSPPTFTLYVNDPDLFTENYIRYLGNRLRDAFPLRGTPVRWGVRRTGRGRRGPAATVAT